MTGAIAARISSFTASAPGTFLALLVATLVAVIVMSAGLGAVPISPVEIVAILGKRIGLAVPASFDARQEYVLLAVRLPRILLGVLVGAGLGMSGTAMQAILRNPLADPALIGTSSGAALGASAAIVWGGAILPTILPTDLAVPAAAFIGGLLASAIVYRAATGGSSSRVGMMLLAGIAVNALAGAGTALVLYMASDAQIRTITFWSMGSLASATWRALGLTAIPILVVLLALPRFAVRLDAILLGESEAGHLGIDVPALRRAIVALAALAVGASVAACGIIGFIGLAAPHIVRLFTGASHRTLLVGSGLFGALLLVLGDLVARTVVSPAELPIGVVTAIIGAPLFLWLLSRRYSEGA
jgi:iron complex transport system permease protein